MTAGNYSQGDQDPGLRRRGGRRSWPAAPAPALSQLRTRRGRRRGGRLGGPGRLAAASGRGASTALSPRMSAAIGREVDGVRLQSAGVTDTAVTRCRARSGSVRPASGRRRRLSVDSRLHRPARPILHRADRSRTAIAGAGAVGGRGGAAVRRRRRSGWSDVEIRRKPFTVIGVVENVRVVSPPPAARSPRWCCRITAAQDLLGITHLHTASPCPIERAGDATRVARDIIVAAADRGTVSARTMPTTSRSRRRRARPFSARASIRSSHAPSPAAS